MSLVNSYIFEGAEYIPSAAGNLYNFTTWTFTNLGGNGRSGPSNTAKYTGAPWPDSINYFSINSGVQTWKVPITGTYKLTVAGASNKYSTIDTRTNVSTTTQTRGSIVSFLANLTSGQNLKIIVGQPGTSTSVTGTGGAGGSFILTDANVPLLIAGGAGGLNGLSGNDPSNCSASSSLVNFDAPQVWPGWSGSYSGTGGTAGSGGSGGSAYSGGGAGISSDGSVSGTGGGSRWTGGYIPNGTISGSSTQSNQEQGNGGFGGGGAAAFLNTGGAGGGGGYSGGAGGNSNTHGTGGSNYYMSPSSSAIFEGFNDVDTTVYPGTSTKTFGFGYVSIALNTPSYTFTDWTFTNLSTTGPTGPPTGSTYSGSNFVGFSVTSGIQSWTVPKFGTYYIVAAGASGGPSDKASGGRGAIVTTSIVLQAGTVLKLLVGQQGTKGTNNGGGGGGSFVAFSSNNSPILVAGGGGGAQSYNNSTFTSGGDATFTPGSGQGASLSWSGTDAGSPGAGYYSDNGFTGTFVGGSAKAFINGGATVTNGGFGGGGTFTTTNSGGGGGGYSGGQAGTDVTAYSQPQGGTCFDWASDVPVSQGFNVGHGYIKIVSTDSTYPGTFDSRYFNTHLLIHTDPTIDLSSFKRTLTGSNLTQVSYQYKIGTSSIQFSGDSSLIASNVSTMNTIEFWVYFNVSPTSNTVFASGDSSWSLRPISGFSNIGLSLGTNWRTGQWYHIAYTRDGNIHRSYRDGNLVGNVANSNTFTFSNITFGTSLNGFMSEVRVSNVARYTSNSFTLQTVPYYPQNQQVLLNLPTEPIIKYTADTIGQNDNTPLTSWNGLVSNGSPLYRNIGGFSYIQFSGSSATIPSQNVAARQMLNFGTNGGATFIYMLCLTDMPSDISELNSLLSFGTPTTLTPTTRTYYTPPINSWFMFVINISGTTMSVYINNTLASTTTLSSALVNLLSTSIGIDLGVTEPMKHHGIVVYDRSLTTNEMTGIYNSISSIIGTNI